MISGLLFLMGWAFSGFLFLLARRCGLWAGGSAFNRARLEELFQSVLLRWVPGYVLETPGLRTSFCSSLGSAWG